MSIELYEHNQSAYEAALPLLSKYKRAAIIHPTGTGKSFIAFKLCDENPTKTICLVSPSEYIYKTQLENIKKLSPEFSNDNITFFTYSKLMMLNEDELNQISPDYIVLDEFHRAGAAEWGKGIERLLQTYPNAPVLGLSATNVRYLDNNRDMAKELFEGHIASQMTLGDAIVRGILNHPKYVLALFSYKQEFEKYKQRVLTIKNKTIRQKAEKYLEALKRALDHAIGMDEIFKKHITDVSGKYIVFCSNVEHMNRMIAQVPDWFKYIDANPNVYTAFSDNPETSKAFADFKKDNSAHLKLLFCIDMLNEGIHVDDVAGVILLRPTVSPIIYKQQIGRALSASSNQDAVIFDIVLNYDNLYSISAIQNEMDIAIDYIRNNDGEGNIVNDSFVVVDELRDCREIFNQLEDSINYTWDFMFERANAYFKEYGNLVVEKRYVDSEGYQLGSWINTQRRVRNGSAAGFLDEVRIAKLDSIGMIWGSLQDRTWEKLYAQASAYCEQNGNLIIPATFVTKDGYTLGRRIANLRNCYNNNKPVKYLTEERIELLNALGMVWNYNDYSWGLYFASANRYFAENKNLNVPCDYVDSDGVKLGSWVSRVRRLYKTNQLSKNLTKEQIDALSALGMTWEVLETKWQQGYREATCYFEEYKNLNVPDSYITETGYKLGKWISNQRDNSASINTERKALLDKLGMVWKKEDPWEVRYNLAKAYYESHGNLLLPGDYKIDSIWLGKWLNEQKQIYRGNRKNKSLTQTQIDRLERISIDWRDTYQINWDNRYEQLKQLVIEKGSLELATEGNSSCRVWLNRQKANYKDGLLSTSQVDKLIQLGVALENDNPWQVGFQHAKAYFDKYGNLKVLHDFCFEDGYPLGVWITNQRSKYHNAKLDKTQIDQLNSIGIEWSPMRNAWEEGFKHLVDYYSNFGIGKVKTTAVSDDGYKIGDWVRSQKRHYQKGNYPLDKLEKLQKIGFSFNE